jgi:hypothetical protein
MHWLIGKAGRWALILAALSMGLGFVANRIYRAGYESAEAKVTAQWSKEREQLLVRHMEEIAQADRIQAEMQAYADTLRRDYDDQIGDITRRYDGVLAELRSRPPRPAAPTPGLPQAPGAGAACTGEGLARPDAEFLAGYAADAAKVAAGFEACMATVKKYREEDIGR